MITPNYHHAPKRISVVTIEMQPSSVRTTSIPANKVYKRVKVLVITPFTNTDINIPPLPFIAQEQDLFALIQLEDGSGNILQEQA